MSLEDETMYLYTRCQNCSSVCHNLYPIFAINGTFDNFATWNNAPEIHPCAVGQMGQTYPVHSIDFKTKKVGSLRPSIALERRPTHSSIHHTHIPPPLHYIHLKPIVWINVFVTRSAVRSLSREKYLAHLY